MESSPRAVAISALTRVNFSLNHISQIELSLSHCLLIVVIRKHTLILFTISIFPNTINFRLWIEKSRLDLHIEKCDRKNKKQRHEIRQN